jgi:tRNA pseudouridine55 synthase
MSQPNEYNGALIIDKPEGLTSHDVVARLRRILRTKKIGHTGTLDPFATGVLVMLVGKATRLARFLDKDSKAYEAVLKFGFETDTGDKTGVRTQETGDSIVELPPRDDLLTRVEAVLPEFRGEITQIPPMYSAKKIKGKKLYELARQGIEVERKPIDISIYEIAMLDDQRTQEDSITISVASSAGTYIRALAEDIGRRIGIGCHLTSLRRTRAGSFGLENALTLEELEAVAVDGRIDEFIISTNTAVAHLPLQRLDESDLDLISHGMKIDARTEYDSVQNIRLANSADELVAIGETDPSGKIQPKVVLISQ